MIAGILAAVALSLLTMSLTIPPVVSYTLRFVLFSVGFVIHTAGLTILRVVIPVLFRLANLALREIASAHCCAPVEMSGNLPPLAYPAPELAELQDCRGGHATSPSPSS